MNLHLLALRLSLALCLTFLSFFSLQGQPDSLHADQQYQKGFQLFSQSKHLEAIPILQAAAEEFHVLALWKPYFKARNYQFWSYFLQLELDSCERIIRHSLAMADQHAPDLHEVYWDQYHLLAAMYGRRGEHELALEWEQKSIDLIRQERGDNDFGLAAAYNGQAISYYYLRDYALALELHQQALRLKLEHYGELHLSVAKSYNNIGIVYREIGEYDRALTHYEKALSIKAQILDAPHASLAQTLNNLATISMDLEAYLKAEAYLLKALEMERVIYPPGHHAIAEKYAVLSTIYSAQQKYELAMTYNQLALRIWEAGGAPNSDYWVKTVNETGRIYRLQGAYHQALQKYQEVLSFLLPDFQPLDLLAHPREDLIVADDFLMLTFDKKGLTLWELYEETDSLAYLMAARDALSGALDIIDLMQTSHLQEDSKFILLDHSREIFESAIAIDFLLWEKTADSTYLADGWALIERNKATLLRASMQAEQAMQFASIPAEILAEEARLKQQLDSLSYELYLARQETEAAPEELRSLSDAHFSIRQAYREFVGKLRQDYPTYHRMMYALQVASLSEAQAYSLEHGREILAYFQGEEHVYRFFIQGQKVQWTRLPWSEKEEDRLDAFLDLLRDPGQARQLANDAEAIRHFALEAHHWYKVLWPPSSTADYPHSMLIPDGKLYHLPFETLLPTLPAAAESYVQLPFLLTQKSFSSHYASSFFLQPLNRHARAGKGLLAMAQPYTQADTVYFAEKRYGFGPLQYVAQEAQAITDLTGGQLLLGPEVRVETFEEVAQSYQVLHLAMHAFTEPEEPLFSGLIFENAAVDSVDQVLHAFELYHMELAAELVVLSACNTGTGKLANGEGILSLGRAFTHAGCENVLMSLWQIDDQATASIMEAFYRHLLDGLPQYEALRLAKLDYLAQKRNVHPHFWAAFSLMGEGKELKIRKRSTFLGGGWTLLLGLVGFISLWAWWRKKQG
ncbi:MAG: CHAT domain-containing tetratricopeptide repeat protein [Bacteroidota bacterium]